jgi:hypothetical protein
MILHIYHCNLAVIRDYRGSQGRNRPDGTGRFPATPGAADIEFAPITEMFGDPQISRLLQMFQHIDLTDLTNSPIKWNWKYIEGTLGCTRQDVHRLLEEVDAKGLLSALTIDYDHEQWMKHSREKGCLVVMTGIEQADLSRDPDERARAFCEAIDAVKRDVTGPEHILRHVFVVPNGHLAPRAEPVNWEEALEVLKTLPPALNRRRYKAKLNSYGYPKLIELAMSAHKRGYLLRAI